MHAHYLQSSYEHRQCPLTSQPQHQPRGPACLIILRLLLEMEGGALCVLSVCVYLVCLCVLSVYFVCVCVYECSVLCEFCVCVCVCLVCVCVCVCVCLVCVCVCV